MIFFLLFVRSLVIYFISLINNDKTISRKNIALTTLCKKKKSVNYTYQNTKINKGIPRYVYVTRGCSLGMCNINKGEPASRIKCLVKPYLSDAE